MRQALRVLLVTTCCASCEGISGPVCYGPFEHIVATFSGYVVRNGTYYPSVRLTGYITDGGAARAPGVTEQWIVAKDVLLNGRSSPGFLSVRVAGNLLPGPAQQPADLSVQMLSPHEVGDSLRVERWPSAGCRQDRQLACVGITDSAVPHPLWVSGTVRVVGRKPAIWALDLVSDPDPRAQYIVVGTIRFRHGTTPRQCYSD